MKLESMSTGALDDSGFDELQAKRQEADVYVTCCRHTESVFITVDSLYGCKAVIVDCCAKLMKE